MESTRLEGEMTKNNLESRSVIMSIGVVHTYIKDGGKKGT